MLGVNKNKNKVLFIFCFSEAIGTSPFDSGTELQRLGVKRKIKGKNAVTVCYILNPI